MWPHIPHTPVIYFFPNVQLDCIRNTLYSWTNFHQHWPISSQGTVKLRGVKFQPSTKYSRDSFEETLSYLKELLKVSSMFYQSLLKSTGYKLYNQFCFCFFLGTLDIWTDALRAGKPDSWTDCCKVTIPFSWAHALFKLYDSVLGHWHTQFTYQDSNIMHGKKKIYAGNLLFNTILKLMFLQITLIWKAQEWHYILTASSYAD